MIDSIYGVITRDNFRPDKIMKIHCKEISYAVRASKRNINEFDRRSDYVFIHIHQRPEYDEWFGFLNESDREIFRDLIQLPKLGPATIMNILDEMDYLQIQKADLVDLLKIKGIGRASAAAIYERYHKGDL
jgi:Holliday junction resolvasome RuvABC DNA-binding subunit